MIGDAGSWNITERGANNIAAMRKRLDVKAAFMESAYKRLLGASVEYGEGLGLYGDVIQAELKAMEVINNECRASVDDLRFRLEQYENVIRAEVEKVKKETEEAAAAAESTGGPKNAR